jgi:hypothetical protein
LHQVAWWYFATAYPCASSSHPLLPCFFAPLLTAGDGDGDGGDDSFFRKVFGELYDAASINAVLQEWYKTMADMPAILRQAAQMGLFSSAALVRFLAMDVRPNVTRFVTRSLPPAVSSCSLDHLLCIAVLPALLDHPGLLACIWLCYQLKSNLPALTPTSLCLGFVRAGVP